MRRSLLILLLLFLLFAWGVREIIPRFSQPVLVARVSYSHPEEEKSYDSTRNNIKILCNKFPTDLTTRTAGSHVASKIIIK